MGRCRVYITSIANRNSPPAVLLRESYREQGKVKSRTLANLSRWPEAKIDALRRVLADEPMCRRRPALRDRARAGARPCRGRARDGAPARARQDAAERPERRAKLIIAMIVARVIEPAAKLATARQLSEATAPIRSAPCSASAKSMPTNSTRPWIG